MVMSKLHLISPLFLERPTLVPTEQFWVQNLQTHGPQRRPPVCSSTERPSLLHKFRPVKPQRAESGETVPHTGSVGTQQLTMVTGTTPLMFSYEQINELTRGRPA